jgi:hypothetical protein
MNNLRTLALLPATDRQDRELQNAPAYARFNKSPMFRLQWQYCQQVLEIPTGNIFVVSYHPDFTVVNAMETIPAFNIHVTREERESWGFRVVDQLFDRIMKDEYFRSISTVLPPADMVENIVTFVSAKQIATLGTLRTHFTSATITRPLAGKGIIGMQMHELKHAIETRTPIPAEPVTFSFEAELTAFDRGEED